jgi:hypothetical protein
MIRKMLLSIFTLSLLVILTLQGGSAMSIQDYSQFYDVLWNTNPVTGEPVVVTVTNESHVVDSDNRIILNQIPSESTGVTITGKYYTKLGNTLSSSSYFSVNWRTGEIIFGGNIVGTTVTVASYGGRGLIKSYAKRQQIEDVDGYYTATETETAFKEIYERVSTIVAEGQTNSEVSDARPSANGESNTVLKDRLDKIENLNQVTSVSTNTVLTLSQRGIIEVTTGATNKTITLPNATTTRIKYIIKKVDSGVGDVVIACNGVQTIDGVATITLSLQYDTLEVVSNGINWNIVSRDDRVASHLAENIQQFSDIDDDILALQTDKVDKVAGKGLSTNDYNNTEKAEVAKVVLKADITYVNSEIAAVVSGAPKGVYATLVDLETAFPTGDTGIYLVTADGKWYYWNTSAWAEGGVYQATSIANGSVPREKTTPNTVSSYNANFIDSGKNLFNKNTVTQGFYVRYDNGNIEANAAYSYSEYIPVEPDTAYTRVGSTQQLYFYDASYNKISGLLNGGTFTTPANAAYVILDVLIASLDTEQLEIGEASTTYEAFGTKLKNPLKSDIDSYYDRYPFQPLANFNNNATAEIEIKKAVKKIEIYGADYTKRYCIGILQRNHVTYGTGIYIYECDTDGTAITIVAVTSGGGYTEPDGVDVFTLNDYASSGITATIYIDWTQITDGTQYGMLSYNYSGIDVRCYMPTVVISLPSTIDAVIGDTLELFYKGILQTNNLENYNINLSASKGKKYKNRWIYTAVEGDTDFNLTVKVYNDSMILLASKVCSINVVPVKSSPVAATNILSVGDSLTAAGVWTTEFDRRLTGTGGTPAGSALTNIEFIGTLGDTTKHEGRSGWTWNNYNSLKDGENPFWSVAEGRNDFLAYSTAHSFTGIDYCYILLGWNSWNTTPASIVTQGKAFVDQLHTDYPACKVVIMGLQVPQLDGYGENYGTDAGLNYYENLHFVFALNKAYEDWTKEAAYSGFMSFIHLSSQFDTDNNMPTSTRTVNVRSATTETYGTNAVHPATEGYYQIADTAYRKFMAI